MGGCHIHVFHASEFHRPPYLKFPLALQEVYMKKAD